MKGALCFLFFLAVAVKGWGQIIFQKTYGGLREDTGNSIQQTSDGGYIIGGSTSVSLYHDFVYLVKTNNHGDTLWTRTFGGTAGNEGSSVQQTTDGGYIIAGATTSYGAGQWDVYLIKADSNGNSLWSKTYGGVYFDFGYCVRQTADGGFIIGGCTSSPTTGNDFYLIKTNSNGDTLWTKVYGGGGDDDLYYLEQTSDDGYIACGNTRSFGAGGTDIYLIRTDSGGNLLWSKTYGDAADEGSTSIHQTTDAGFIISGRRQCAVCTSDIRAYLIKTDSNGDTLWTKNYGGSSYVDGGHFVQQTYDGGYILAGITTSYGAGSTDIYLVKTDANGDSLWTRTIGGSGADEPSMIQQTTDSGYIITGYSTSFVTSFQDLYLIKTDVNGNSGCNEEIANSIAILPSITIINPATILHSTNTIITTPLTIDSSGGAVNTLCISTSTQFSIFNFQSAIDIYPNPISSNQTSHFTLTYPPLTTPSQIIINNIDGKEEGRYSLPQWSSTQKIKLPPLAAGIYVARLVNEQGRVGDVKFVVQ